MTGSSAATLGDVQEQYFSDHAPAADSDLRTLRFEARGAEFVARVSPKVFSATHLDLGTRQLLSEAPDLPSQGRFLDLGCGWGPIGLAMAKEAPGAEVWAIDVNSRAVDLARRNASINGCPNLRALDAEEALEEAESEDLRFDAIWSNPPIRIGKEALHGLLLAWLPRLSADGAAHLVVQRNLGADSLIDWLNGQGLRAVKFASKKGFRIIEVRIAS
nr:methyltransferase [Schaalia hyovaginalis]